MMASIITQLFPIFGNFSWEIIAFFLIGTLCFIVGIIGANVWPQKTFSRIYFIGAVWHGVITIAGFIAVFALFIGMIFDYSYTNNLWAIAFVVITLLTNIWGIYASWIPRIVTYQVHIDKEHTWHGKKIVMIADTHYGNIYGTRDAKALVNRINKLSPEIVLIPGDFFDGPFIDYSSIVREFGCIKAPHGVLFANGNHEEYTHTKTILKSIKHPILRIRKPASNQKLQDSLQECKQEIVVINNEKVEIDGMVFAWVTYHDTETPVGLIKNLDLLNLDDAKPTILLKHKPTLHTTLEKYPIDLVISGHTHRWQMFPFSLVTDIVYGKYVYGKVEKGGQTAITTSGVGSWWPPQRVGTRSEIVVIEIV
jgi:predicted MPP superfamily phosphohydrolase